MIVYNGKIAPAHEAFFREQAVITMAHNYLRNVDARFVKKGFPGAVVGQYQAALPEFTGWSAVPNPLPFWESVYQDRAKPKQISICCTPFGKHEKYAANDKLFRHSKNFETTTRVLENLANRYRLKLETVAEKQVSHAESVAMKCRALSVRSDEMPQGFCQLRRLDAVRFVPARHFRRRREV